MLPSASGQALLLGAGTVWKELLAPDGIHPESDNHRREPEVDYLDTVNMNTCEGCVWN
jgi:hypothetical protein